MQMTTTDVTGRIVRQEFPWSYSALRNFETCAHRYEQVDLLKNIKEPDSPQLKEGFYVHDKLANRINNKTPLPPNVPYEHWARYAEEGPGWLGAEQKLAITKDMQPCEYFDKIKKVWHRTVVDVLRLDQENCHIIDWKTGKVDPKPDQLMLNALCTLIHHPDVFNIKAEFVWLNYNTKTTIECTVDEVVEYWVHKVAGRVQAFQDARNAGVFPKNPSGLCKKHCPVHSCEHCGQ